ncbi:hypothetical protein BM536_009215 [Streptomyces phaeoluteigriseus]|uniref:Uncharacterized protein n=1 Tax=Streptomyces phaeoluteigriseus TaxID=114686 RepID=A0A1V6MVM2_9ACTN|nr:hypothetical protein BM536_009215 [Streptomyces phaeoluteigriseus]
MAGPIVRRGAALGLGAAWWWAVVRLAVSADAGVLEGAVAAGGWGLSLPAGALAWPSRAPWVRSRRGGGGPAWRGERGEGGSLAGWSEGRGGAGERLGVVVPCVACDRLGAVVSGAGTTRAWPRRRSGGGSGPW